MPEIAAVYPELIYDDFLMRLDGPVIEVMSREIKGLLRLHVNFAQASIKQKKDGRIEVEVDDGGAVGQPFLQPEINGIWGVWKKGLPASEEPTLIEFFAEADRRRQGPRSV